MSDPGSLSTEEWLARQKKRMEEADERERREAIKRKRMASSGGEGSSSRYRSSELEGLKVGHDVNQFDDGKEIILTLKDTSVLGKKKLNEMGADDDLELSEDELENIELRDKEKVTKRMDAKSKVKKPAYDVYDESESLLAQYDDNDSNHNRGGFRIGSASSSSSSDAQANAIIAADRAAAVKAKLTEGLDDGYGSFAVASGASSAATSAAEVTSLAGATRVISDFMSEEEMPKFRRKKKAKTSASSSLNGDGNDQDQQEGAGTVQSETASILASIMAPKVTNTSASSSTSSSADRGSRTSRAATAATASTTTTTRETDTSLSSSSSSSSSSTTASSSNSNSNSHIGSNSNSGASTEAMLLKQRQALRDASYLKALRRAEEETARMIQGVKRDETAEDKEYEEAMKVARLSAASKAAHKTQKEERAAVVAKMLAEAKKKREAAAAAAAGGAAGGAGEASGSSMVGDGMTIKTEDGSSGGIVVEATTEFLRNVGAGLDGTLRDDEDESVAARIKRKLAQEHGTKKEEGENGEGANASMLDQVRLEPSIKQEGTSPSTSTSSAMSDTNTKAVVKEADGDDDDDNGPMKLEPDDEEEEEEESRDVDVNLFDDEPTAATGIAAALALARKRGLIKEKEKSTGPVIRYTDDDGRELDTKEAFKHMSRHFHGIFSGLNKEEKRRKKLQEAERLRKLAAGGADLLGERLAMAREVGGQAGIVVGGADKGRVARLAGLVSAKDGKVSSSNIKSEAGGGSGAARRDGDGGSGSGNVVEVIEAPPLGYVPGMDMDALMMAPGRSTSTSSSSSTSSAMQQGSVAFVSSAPSSASTSTTTSSGAVQATAPLQPQQQQQPTRGKMMFSLTGAKK